MTKEKIEELVIDETSNAFPGLELTNQSYYWGLVKIFMNTIVNDYALDSIGSESTVRELIKLDIENLKKSLK